jgi:hypothetical protein
MKFLFKKLIKLTCNRYVCAVLVLIITFIAGGKINEKVNAPDLHRLYMESMMVNDQPPVVFIHGVLGSKLKDEDEEGDLWLGSLDRILLVIDCYS